MAKTVPIKRKKGIGLHWQGRRKAANMIHLFLVKLQYFSATIVTDILAHFRGIQSKGVHYIMSKLLKSGFQILVIKSQI